MCHSALKAGLSPTRPGSCSTLIICINVLGLVLNLYFGQKKKKRSFSMFYFLNSLSLGRAGERAYGFRCHSYAPLPQPFSQREKGAMTRDLVISVTFCAQIFGCTVKTDSYAAPQANLESRQTSRESLPPVALGLPQAGALYNHSATNVGGY